MECTLTSLGYRISSDKINRIRLILSANSSGINIVTTNFGGSFVSGVIWGSYKFNRSSCKSS